MTTKTRGFASYRWSPAKRKAVSAKGGRAAHKKSEGKKPHEFNSESAKAASAKGLEKVSMAERWKTRRENAKNKESV